MEEIKARFFDGTRIKTKELVQDIMQKPGEAEKILENVFKTAGFLMKKEALENKFKHKMRELHEEYDIDFNK